MIELFTKKNGAISVFLVIILVPVIVVTSLFVDASRLRLAKGVVSSAGDLTMNTVLTQYDPILNDYYGLLASAQDIDTFLATADEYFMACITSQGVEKDDARQFADQVSGLLTGSGGEIVDLLQIATAEGGEYKIAPMENGDMTNAALMKKEIVEFMKYRAPINMVADLFEKFKNASKDLENAEDNTELVKKKEEYYSKEGAVVEKALEAYKHLLAYNKLDITEESVNELKSIIDGVEEKYKRLHVKMVKDLYNTQGLTVFNRGSINFNYTVDESNLNVNHVNSYINNVSTAIETYLQAAQNLENLEENIPEYNSSTMYDIQYWVACNEVLEQNSYYTNYVRAANSLIKNMKNLEKVMELQEEGEDQEEYTLAARTGVNARGTATRATHYTNLKNQYDSIYTNELQDTNSFYWKITDNLSRISSQHINDIKTAETDAEIQDIYNKINEHYNAYDDALEHLTNAVKALGELKTLISNCNTALENWDTAIDSTETTLSTSDSEEMEKLLADDEAVLKNITEENTQELIDRLNNVKSLLGSLKEGIDGYKYNNYKVREINNYSKFREKSGVNINSITYVQTDLFNYSESSFRFTKSDTLARTGITNNNHPSIQTVNVPELYQWMVTEFGEYEDDPTGTQGEIETEKGKYESEKNKKADTTIGYFGSSNEISTGAGDLPSKGYAGCTEGSFEQDLTKVSSFVSGLFSNLSETLGGAAISARDDLFALSYIMGMFSYDTYEYEGKYQILEGNVTESMLPGQYDSANSQWSDTKPSFTKNKSLTNKMISTGNNYSYGNEVEYILYGKTNKKNKDSAYGTIFAIRYVLDLAPMSIRYFSKEYASEGDALSLEGTALAVQAASQGIIPKSLFKLAVVLGLTAGEAAKDIKKLSKGMPVKLIKEGKDVEFRYVGSTSVPEESKDGFFYSDYLKLILLLKLSSSEEYGIYARTADVIQANMRCTADSDFLMSKAKVYYKATATVQVEPLMLSVPLISNSGYSAPESGNWNKIKYTGRRGY